MIDRIAEMIAARQAPGVVVGRRVRSGGLTDVYGNSTRAIFGGESQREAEKQLVEMAVEDGVDLRTSRLTIREEAGQGVGKERNRGRDYLRPTKDTVKRGKSRLD